MLYEVVLYGSYFDQQTVNRWNYASSGAVGTVLGSFALASAMGFIPMGDPPSYPSGGIFDTILALGVSTMIYTSATVRAASNYAPSDFYEVSFGQGALGKFSGQGMSPAVAVGFRSTRTRTDIARGTKRFAGVAEEFVGAGGVITDTNYLNVMNELAALMDDSLVYTEAEQTLTFTPVVVSKEKVTLPNGNTTYRYYPTLAEQVQHLSISPTWQPYPTVRTQVSRQYGRGK